MDSKSKVPTKTKTKKVRKIIRRKKTKVKKKSPSPTRSKSIEKTTCLENGILSDVKEFSRTDFDFWITPDKVDFINWIKTIYNKRIDQLADSKTAKKYKFYANHDKSREKSFLRHQLFVINYIQQNSPYRGILLYHGLGAGKTAASIGIADGLSFENKVVIMLPASLSNNYRSEIKEFSSMMFRKQNNWCFVQSLPNSQIEKELVEKHGFSLDYIRTKKKINTKHVQGAWLIDTKGKDKYPPLTEEELVSLDNQIDILLETKYQILHYNDRSYILRNIFKRLLLPIEYLELTNLLFQKQYPFISHEKTSAGPFKTWKDLYYFFKNELGGEYGYGNKKKNSYAKKLNKGKDICCIRGCGEFATKSKKSVKFCDKHYKEYIENKTFCSDYTGQWTGSIQGKNKDMKESVDRMITHILTQNNRFNPFNNKTVVIDEIHNLIASTMGSGYSSIRIYALLMNSENSRLVLLSGTPLINDEYEMALLINLLKGYTKSYQFRINESLSKTEIENITDELKYNIPGIHRLEVTKNQVLITKNPNHFISISKKDKQLGLVNSENLSITNKYKTNTQSENEFIYQIIHIINKNLNSKTEINRSNLSVQFYTPYPDFLLCTASPGTCETNFILANKQYQTIPVFKKGIEVASNQFRNLFINKQSGTIRYPKLFIKRMIGCISYYNRVNADIFPDVFFMSDNDQLLAIAEKPQSIDMSDYQLVKYSQARGIELDLEKKKGIPQNLQKEIATQVSKKSNSLYRIFSRQICNFAFPPSIQRPYPSDIRKTNKMIASDVDNENLEFVEYGVELKKAIDNLSCINLVTKNSFMEEYYQSLNTKVHNMLFDNDFYTLSVLSPKYSTILDNILYGEDGSIFIYSQFRSVEGIELFAKVLEYNGFTKYNVEDIGKPNIYSVNQNVMVQDGTDELKDPYYECAKINKIEFESNLTKDHKCYKTIQNAVDLLNNQYHLLGEILFLKKELVLRQTEFLDQLERYKKNIKTIQNFLGVNQKGDFSILEVDPNYFQKVHSLPLGIRAIGHPSSYMDQKPKIVKDLREYLEETLELIQPLINKEKDLQKVFEKITNHYNDATIITDDYTITAKSVLQSLNKKDNKECQQIIQEIIYLLLIDYKVEI